MKTKDLGKGAVVYVEDNLDWFNCSELRSQVIALIARDKKDIVINLARANYVDSSGIGILVFISNLLQRYNRTLKLTALQPTVMAIINTSRLNEVWQVYESVEQAVASFEV